MPSPRAHDPRPLSGAILVLAAWVLAGCAQRSSPDEPMAIARIAPELDADRPPRVFLNQELTVYFSHPVEKSSVNRDTFRVVDSNGNHVDGRLRVGLRSVTFEPVPPVAATLDDGSFHPSGRYTLEIAGLPLWNALRSTSGERLQRGFSCSFDVVPSEASEDHATPFLPHGAVTEPFGLMERTEPRLAADVGTVDLHFNLAVLPSSATVDALQVYEVSSGQRQRVWPESVRVLGERRPHAEHYGSTVRLSFGPGRLEPWPSLYYMFLQGSEGQSLRDYLGRPLVDGDRVLELDVVPGDRPRVLVIGGSEPWHLSRGIAAPLGFAVRGSRAEVQCGVEAGDGRHGWLRPRSALTIRPGEAFDSGDGVLVEAGTDLQFLGIDIQPGVTVRIESREPIRIRSVGSASVRGRLVLDTPIGVAGWLGGERFGQGEIVDFERLLEASGCALIVGGDFHNAGSIEHVREGEPGSPMTIVAAGDVDSTGRAPAEVIVGMDHRSQAIRGALESPICLTCRLTRGLPAHTDLIAESWTEWIRLPTDHPPVADVESIAPIGAVEVAVQIAPPHSVDPTRPDLARHRLTSPTSTGERVELPQGSFVRFRIRARVRPGELLPSLGGIVVYAAR